MSDSLERIRHSPTTDNIHSIVMSTTEILKSNRRDDLCTRFTNDLRNVMAKWQGTQGSASISTTTVTDDNFIEENMDVDDDQDDKHKKQITTSSTSNISSECNDIDYRFLDQDMDHHKTITTTHNNHHRKQRRKSRFSDLLPTGNKLKSNISNFLKDEKEKSTIVKADPQIDNVKITSTKSTDKHIKTSLSSKFQPIMNSTESFISSINIKDKLVSKPICFSFSKDPLRRHKPNISSTRTNNDDRHDSSPKFVDDLIKQVEPTSMLNLLMQQQKTKHRYSSSTNEWRFSNKNNYMKDYHDLDQPQE